MEVKIGVVDSPRELTVASGVAEEYVTLAHDPQTNGGLLAPMRADRVEGVRHLLRDRGVDSWIVGRVDNGSGVSLT